MLHSIGPVRQDGPTPVIASLKQHSRVLLRASGPSYLRSLLLGGTSNPDAAAGDRCFEHHLGTVIRRTVVRAKPCVRVAEARNPSEQGECHRVEDRSLACAGVPVHKEQASLAESVE